MLLTLSDSQAQSRIDGRASLSRTTSESAVDRPRAAAAANLDFRWPGDRSTARGQPRSRACAGYGTAAAGGHLVVEAVVPDPTRLDRDQHVEARAVGTVRLDVACHDPVAQTVFAQQVAVSADGIRLCPVHLRYLARQPEPGGSARGSCVGPTKMRVARRTVQRRVRQPRQPLPGLTTVSGSDPGSGPHPIHDVLAD